MYTLDVLIPFELVIDIDLGLIKLLKFEYRNEFYPGILDGDDDCIRCLLMKRENPNPLSIAYIHADEHPEIMDTYYEQFMEREYTRILELSAGTALADMTKVASFSSDQIVRITVMCRTEQEKEVLIRRKINPHRIIVSHPSKIKVSDYNCIYVKNIADLDLYKNVSGINIFIASYNFNVLEDPESLVPALPIEVIAKYSMDNEIRLFTVYNVDPRKVPIE